MSASAIDARPMRPILWSKGRAVSLAELLAQARAAAASLPASTGVVNLCEARALFIAAFCAALLRQQTTYLPAARAPGLVLEVLDAYAGSICIDDAVMDQVASAASTADAGSAEFPRPSPELVAALAFTSGTTGMPQRHRKLWRSLLSSTALNVAAVRAALPADARPELPWIVATVPPQHMYGFETSVLMPLLGGMAVHAGRPLFPADVAASLLDVPTPRILVTTPVHLRALLESGQSLPPVALVISATAPLDAPLARSIETAWNTRVLEMFGSTETCVIATRETARDADWRPYSGVSLQPEANGTRVTAPWFEQPLVLQDLLEVDAGGRFSVRGRNADMIEVAGKRASLAELTERLRALEGVRDAAVFQLDAPEGGGVRRIAALVVAPGCDARALRVALSERIDRAFLPRPLLLVDALPRNELGKLPRARLIAALRAAEGQRGAEN